MTANNFISTLPNIYYGFQTGVITYAAGSILRITGGINPKSHYNVSTYTFTAPSNCMIKIEVSVVIAANSTGDISIVVYNGSTVVGAPYIIYLQKAFGAQTGAGMCVGACASGDQLTITTITACSIAMSSCIFTVL